MPSNRSSSHRVYRLQIQVEPNAGATASPAHGAPSRRVACVYENGQRVAGKEGKGHPHPDHPEVRLSVGDQDGIVFESNQPFMAQLKDAPPDLFYRDPPWRATQGRDRVYRVNSGPVSDYWRDKLPLQGTKWELLVHALKDGAPDPDVEELDPHVIIEP